MMPALPDIALAPSYAQLPIAGPRAQNVVATPLIVINTQMPITLLKLM